MKILDTVKCSHDLKKLNTKQLISLSGEIRELLINVVSKNGGHLASNLGVVELTVAIHKVFNLPEDKVVFDVGHQSYVHKILTGRKDMLDTLRKYGGISGFPKTSESEYDAFNTGHSSTSVSVAYAISKANSLNGRDNYAIALIGDAAISNGLAFEALNNAGLSGSKLIVILNDNEMSIAKNVGNISNYLTELRTRPSYHKAKEDVHSFLNKVPFVGKKIAKLIYGIKSAIKHTVIPDTMFEDLGFTYMGPVDGHDITKLCTVLERAKSMDKPVLVHAVTKKGKGYEFAEEKPHLYHGIGSFDINASATDAIDEKSYSYIAGQTACTLAQKDENIVAICAAMEEATGLRKFHISFPDRFFDVGISEGHAVTFASGLASQGKIPMVFIYSTFLQRAYDNIVHDAALSKQHIVLCVDRAGLVGADGETHHGVFDIAYLSHIPGITVLTPYTRQGLEAALKTAVCDVKGTVAVRYPRGAAPDGNVVDDVFKAELLREGHKVTVVTMSRMSEIVAGVDFDGDHINLNSVKPLDIDAIIKSVRKTGRLITAEDNLISGGMGEMITSELYRRGIFVKTENLGIKDRFVTHGSVDELLRENGLDKDSIKKRIDESL